VIPIAKVKPDQYRGTGVSSIAVESGDRWDLPRVYVKRQTAYWCRPLWRIGRRTLVLEREVRGLNAFRALGVRVPRVLSFQKSEGQGELVLSEISDSQPLDQAVGKDQAVAENQAGTGRREIIGNLARVVGTLHRGGWTHGALYPAHILVARDNSIALIDLEKARRSFFRRRGDLDRLFRHADFLGREDVELFEREYRIVVRQKWMFPMARPDRSC
jgi:tRNA A-37 threonylcarbamoyl transferase component Bud32